MPAGRYSSAKPSGLSSSSPSSWSSLRSSSSCSSPGWPRRRRCRRPRTPHRRPTTSRPGVSIAHRPRLGCGPQGAARGPIQRNSPGRSRPPGPCRVVAHPLVHQDRHREREGRGRPTGRAGARSLATPEGRRDPYPLYQQELRRCRPPSLGGAGSLAGHRLLCGRGECCERSTIGAPLRPGRRAEELLRPEGLDRPATVLGSATLLNLDGPAHRASAGSSPGRSSSRRRTSCSLCSRRSPRSCSTVSRTPEVAIWSRRFARPCPGG